MSSTDNTANSFDEGVPDSIPPVDPGYGDDQLDGALITPGNTATGAGEAELGTTEADVSDGSEQKQAPVDDGPVDNVVGS